MIQEQKIVVCPACPWEGYWTDDRTPRERRLIVSLRHYTKENS